MFRGVDDAVTVEVVNCGTFYLWSMPTVVDCAHAYCTSYTGLDPDRAEYTPTGGWPQLPGQGGG